VEAEHIFPSFLARDIRDGRLGVPVNRYTARLVVRDANLSIPLYGLDNPIIPPSAECAVPKRTIGEWVRFEWDGVRVLPMGMVPAPLEEHLLMCSELPGSASEDGRIHDRIEGGGGSAEGCCGGKRPPSHSLCSGISSEIAGNTLRQRRRWLSQTPPAERVA
jgi:hypothetical protein